MIDFKEKLRIAIEAKAHWKKLQQTNDYIERMELLAEIKDIAVAREVIRLSLEK